MLESLEYQPAASDAQRLYARERNARSIYSHLPPTTLTRTRTHMHALQRRKALYLSFTARYPEIQMLQTRTRTLMRKRYGSTGTTVHDRPRKLVYLLLASSWVSSALIPSYGSL